MIVKLKILHGKLQSKRGGSAGSEVEIRGPKFVIGSAVDCSMRCPSSAVSPHHCEVSVDSRGVVIRNLDSETGVWVNDESLEDERLLKACDHLKIGHLEFEVLIDEPVPGVQAEQAADAEAELDSVADDISDSLIDADEQDRVHRIHDPGLREFHLEQAAEEAKKQEAVAKEEPAKATKGRKKGKPVMGKFTPPPPPPQPENTEDAAQEALRKLFGN
jgi:pSer/pThr/pTyr-binding forkhead associated (FHA) protein